VGTFLAEGFLEQFSERLIGGKDYGSAAPVQQMDEEYGIEMIASNRYNGKQRTQAGTQGRRYRRRSKVNRLFAWMT